ncbi:hypothetical protein HAX54_024212, partial [Datura stramonium]|nr:hypothetical protein [Datura stramonium]
MSGAPCQRCPDIEKFNEHLGKIEEAARQTLSEAKIIGNLTILWRDTWGSVP